MSPSGEGAILTLEPLMEAVREAIEEVGWELSGLQKTTSHQFEGRWEGESTRSAYLFFHAPKASDPVSVDVYLDETSRGLTGNLALVVDLVDLGALGDPAETLRELGTLFTQTLPDGYNTPVTLRLRLRNGADDPSSAESEVRFKVRLPRSIIAEGPDAVRGLCATAMNAFHDVLSSAALRRSIATD
jgi:hypothetical protein